MGEENRINALREAVRRLERKLGLVNDLQSECCGVTFAQCHAIVEIGRTKSISLNDLAKTLGLDKSTVSRTINNLVNNGLAVREIDAQDRRYVTIKLTEQGLQSFRDIEDKMGAYFHRIYHLIPEAEREQVIEALQILFGAMEENDCCKQV